MAKAIVVKQDLTFIQMDISNSGVASTPINGWIDFRSTSEHEYFLKIFCVVMFFCKWQQQIQLTIRANSLPPIPAHNGW